MSNELGIVWLQKHQGNNVNLLELLSAIVKGAARLSLAQATYDTLQEEKV
jgi:hypothetical protein